jgi:hypothetical protein
MERAERYSSWRGVDEGHRSPGNAAGEHELFTFLDDPAVPADYNRIERDIRSLAAARSGGGTHRADRSAAAIARLKSMIVTAMKNQVRFIRYEIEVVRAKLRGERLPLPLTATPDTS